MKTVLGLDLGAESIGWALLESNDGRITSVVAAGSHCFDAGVEGDIESGRDESRAKARRDARQPRRQHWRRAFRRKKVLSLLQKHGLIPNDPIDTPEQIHETINRLDASLREKHVDAADRIGNHLLPYRLRAMAIEKKLEPFELGRALYHLAQRRGFLSNRKAGGKKEEDGVVKEGIEHLNQDMQAAGCQTYGQYFAQLDPEETRIRQRWTSRQEYQKEFNLIWSTQASHHAHLTDEVKTQIYDAIFDQRPLKSQKHLIGACELVPGSKRAPMGLRIAQRFRMLQKVNDLAISEPEARFLTSEERDKVIDAMEREGDLTFARIRRKDLLGLPKGTKFNLEEGGEKKIPGHRTDAKLREVFDGQWASLSELDRDQLVEDLMTYESDHALIKRLMNKWELDRDAAETLAEMELEPDYSRHSRQALTTLVKRMEEGLPYATARKDEFPETFDTNEALESLPPVLDAVQDLRNPAVCRALTELRKVVNAIIRRHGKPEVIRIELARDLKRGKKQRQDQSKRMRQNENSREAAKKMILDKMRIAQPKSIDIEKIRLAEECDWICPYTGRSIDIRDLLGDTPQFDIEHIWPMSRSLDNSYINKTLCYHEENRHRKRNLTPYEAYSADKDRWHEMLLRVKSFQGDAARIKLQRFMAEEIPEGFTARQLQDTRYTSRLAGDYLALLYGGRSDASGKLRIQCSAGGMTHHMRNEWQLNGILNDGGTKTRDDHRHHAVDAIVTGMIDTKTVQTLEKAAADRQGRRLFAPITMPWNGFVDDVRGAIDKIHVSHRASRKINGPLHAESLYSKPIPGHGEADVRHIRKELHKLSPTEVKGDQIVDPVIRKLVQDKLAKLGGTPDKIFSDPNNHPHLTTHDGRRVSIHKVRVRAKVKPWKIGTGVRERHVTAKPGSNHHTVIVVTVDKDGKDKRWDDHPISRFEVVTRRRTSKPVIQYEWPDNQVFRFSLVLNDHVVMEDDDGIEQLYRITTISKGDMEFRLHTDARTKKEIAKSKARVRASAEKLRQRNARKVTVSYLGEIRIAND